MNNKGFTVVELITTFVVASVIALILFNVVLSIKNIYYKTNLKTNLLINQSNLSNQINSKVLNEDIISIDHCTLSIKCYKITYSNGESVDLVIKEKEILFGDYIYKLEDGTYADLDNTLTGLYYKTISGIVDNKDSILNIKIPIKNNRFENTDFGINFIYLYNSGDIDFNGIPSNG